MEPMLIILLKDVFRYVQLVNITMEIPQLKDVFLDALFIHSYLPII